MFLGFQKHRFEDRFELLDREDHAYNDKVNVLPTTVACCEFFDFVL